jgi:hypothetical protein
MTTTRKSLREKVGKETGLATLVTATSGTTTTIVDSTSVLTGAYSASRWPRGTAIRMSVLNGAASTEGSTIDHYDPKTGTVTLANTLTTAVDPADTAEIWERVDSVSRIDEAIDRALTRHCYQWVNVPLTKVPDGDMGDSGVTHWTASVSTVTKVSMPWPFSWGKRYLRVLNAGYAASDAIPAQAGDVWRLDVLGYVLTGEGTVVVRDNTNSAAITLSGDAGSYTGTGWKRFKYTFTIPTGCEAISLRLGSTGATDDSYWTSVVAHQVNERRFTLPRRIPKWEDVGECIVRVGDKVEEFASQIYALGGRHLNLQDSPAGVVVELNTAMGTGDPVYVEEASTYDALATDAATTECDENLAVAAITYEVYKGMSRKTGSTQESKSGYVTPSEDESLMKKSLQTLKGWQLTAGAGDRKVHR